MDYKTRGIVNLLAIIVYFSVCIVIPDDLHAAEQKNLSAAGCKTEHFLMKDLYTAYQKKTNHSIRLGKTGNKKAVKMLLENQVDFAYTCKPISKLSKKFKIDKSKIANWQSIPIGKDPIVVVSNQKNGVKSISMKDLTKVFEGKITNWMELGGNDLPVKTGYLSPEVESGIVLLFKEFTVGKDGILDKTGTQLMDPGKLGNFVAATPGGVAFMALNSYHQNQGIILDIDGTKPIRENILNGKYKLSATYYLTVPDNKNAVVADFVKYSLSNEGQMVISKNFIPYSE